MKSILIASGSEKNSELLKNALLDLPYTDLTAVKSASEIREIMSGRIFDVIVVNTPLKDESGVELACDIAYKSESGVVLLVKKEYIDSVRAGVEKFGIAVLSKNVSLSVFLQTINTLSAVRSRMNALSKENEKLKIKLNELKLVDRAKCALIQYLNMTEATAHHYIEKQAMDMQCTKREIAENIIKMYEN